jgi:hypothetical protein
MLNFSTNFVLTLPEQLAENTAFNTLAQVDFAAFDKPF